MYWEHNGSEGVGAGCTIHSSLPQFAVILSLPNTLSRVQSCWSCGGHMIACYGYFVHPDVTAWEMSLAKIISFNL